MFIVKAVAATEEEFIKTWPFIFFIRDTHNTKQTTHLTRKKELVLECLLLFKVGPLERDTH